MEWGKLLRFIQSASLAEPDFELRLSDSELKHGKSVHIQLLSEYGTKGRKARWGGGHCISYKDKLGSEGRSIWDEARRTNGSERHKSDTDGNQKSGEDALVRAIEGVEVWRRERVCGAMMHPYRWSAVMRLGVERTEVTCPVLHALLLLFPSPPSPNGV